jgi:hypothetical protein
MADEIAFSGSGAPDLSVHPRYSEGSTDNDMPDTSRPVFFTREGNDAIEREVSPQMHATAKEEAMRLDAIAGTGDGRAEQSAPVV